MTSRRTIDPKLLLKSKVFRAIGPHAVRRLQSFFGAGQLEEVEVVYDYFLSESTGAPRTMVDVGAHYGTSLGRFAADGWTVHAFEPDDHNRNILKIRHGHRSNLTINNLAASDVSGGEAEFYTSDVSTGISGLEAFDSSHAVSQKVPLIRLDDYCRNHGLEHIDFLKIDTEGHDLFVLRGIDFSRIPTDVIVCEFEDRKTSPRGYDRFDLARHLTERGYKIAISEWFPIQAYGAKHKWKAFRDTMDQTAADSWGNIIAFKKEIPQELFHEYSTRFRSH